MNYKSALDYGTRELSILENPKLETEVILSELLGIERTALRTDPDKPIGFFKARKFKKYIHRRQKHQPTAYIFGYKRWNDLKIFVNKQTLIPRDETETMTHHIAQSYAATQTSNTGIHTQAELKINRSPKHILDIGTGSGCLAIWAKKMFPNAIVQALDTSPQALSVAQKNAAYHQTQIKFARSDLLAAIPIQASFDLIIANLPYIPKDMALSKEVRREPKLALFSGPDGLNHIRRLAEEIKTKNIIFEHLWLEFLPTQTDEIKAIFSDYQIHFHQDVSGQNFFAQIKAF